MGLFFFFDVLHEHSCRTHEGGAVVDAPRLAGTGPVLADPQRFRALDGLPQGLGCIRSAAGGRRSDCRAPLQAAHWVSWTPWLACSCCSHSRAPSSGGSDRSTSSATRRPDSPTSWALHPLMVVGRAWESRAPRRSRRLPVRRLRVGRARHGRPDLQAMARRGRMGFVGARHRVWRAPLRQPHATEPRGHRARARSGGPVLGSHAGSCRPGGARSFRRIPRVRACDHSIAQRLIRASPSLPAAPSSPCRACHPHGCASPVPSLPPSS